MWRPRPSYVTWSSAGGWRRPCPHCGPSPPVRTPKRLRQLLDALIAVKRRRADDDPELFAAYRTLAADAKSIVDAHVGELVGLTAMVIRSSAKEGTFRKVDAMATARAVLAATSRFHHPAHAAEWIDPAIDAAYDNVWRLLIDGLCVPKYRR